MICMVRKVRKICIVSPGVLPIPDVLGGAVERLITMIVQTNEIEHLFDITVLSCPNKQAIVFQKNFKHTEFVNISSYNSDFVMKWSNKIKWHLNALFDRNFIILDYVSSPVNRYLRKNSGKFDFIVSECSNPSFCSSISKKVGRDRLAVHLHGNLKSSQRLETVFGNVFSVSDFIKNQYSVGSSLPKERLVTIFNGIATEKFSRRLSLSNRRQLRSQLGLSEDDFVSVFCGRIVPNKGVLELIHALLSIDNPKVKLVILGSSNFGLGDFGKYPSIVKKLAEENKDRIVFTGFVNNDEVYKYHQIADIGVMPSMHNDPCPLSLFELITSGLPTIATKAGGMPEIGNDETTIFVSMQNIEAELKEAMLKLYKDSSLREKMHLAAIERAKDFTQKRFYHDFCNSIDRLIELNEKAF